MMNRLIVVALVATLGIAGVTSSRIFNPVGSKGAITWYTDCPDWTNIGRVVNVSLTNCDASSCTLKALDSQRLVLFYEAGDDYNILYYQIRLSSDRDESDYLIAAGTGVNPVVKGDIVGFGTNFAVPVTIPAGSNYKFQLRRFANSERSELCLEFSLDGIDNEFQPTFTPSPTTVSPTTTIQPISTTTGEPLPYYCKTPGVFPDPYSCKLYHVCTRYNNGSIWDQTLPCAPGTTFCRETKDCNFEPVCPCWL